MAAVCKLEERLVHMDDESLFERRKTYELIGDGCAFMESYKKALEYYHLALQVNHSIFSHFHSVLINIFIASKSLLFLLSLDA